MRWLRRVLDRFSGHNRDGGCSLGERGEREAKRFLRKAGYKILFENYRNRFGEIDLIARDRAQLVFVEVRTRSSSEHGAPIETIDRVKRQRLCRAATGFLQSRPELNLSPRFDVVTIIWNNEEVGRIEHVRHAFDGNDI